MIPPPPDRYAGVGPRLLAFALDWLVLAAYASALALATFLLRSVFRASATALPNPVLANLLALLTLIGPAALYFALGESGPGQATWGKRKLGLRVLTLAGGRLSRGQALARAAGKLVPWELAHTCLFAIPGWPLAPAAPEPWVLVGFGVVWVLVGADLLALALPGRHRTPYDWAAGSVVVVWGQKSACPNPVWRTSIRNYTPHPDPRHHRHAVERDPAPDQRGLRPARLYFAVERGAKPCSCLTRSRPSGRMR